jgi:hypothetical protein
MGLIHFTLSVGRPGFNSDGFGAPSKFLDECSSREASLVREISDPFTADSSSVDIEGKRQ